MTGRCATALVAAVAFIAGGALALSALESYFPSSVLPFLASNSAFVEPGSPLANLGETPRQSSLLARPEQFARAAPLPPPPPCPSPAHVPAAAAPPAQQPVQASCESGSANVRIAICLVGEARAFVNDRLPSHMHAVLVKPLCGAAALDVYAHLGGFGQNDVDPDKPLWKNPLEEERMLLESHVHRVAGPFGSVKSMQLYRYAYQPKPCDGGKCLCKGYGMQYKLRNCMDEIEAHESQQSFQYDFVLKVRPDFEYFRSLPLAPEWDHLRRDIVWTWIATKKGRGLFKGGFSAEFLHMDLLPIDKVDFMDDNMAILPRKVARTYLHIADDIERCVPNVKPNPFSNTDGCKNERWWWNECRVETALRSIRDVNLTIGMMSDKGFFGKCNFLDCLLHECAYPGRRDRGDAERKKPFLTMTPEQSKFPLAALM
mmetsp:Transcript_152650/g.489565  ORF Transcript_152650/g.489565 Transcript_152650/m.489565 type:complete len:429 (+) Transcript_152650:40-1326(+)|eukprot:CAMPEP_0204185518 /NCGR_PEP_ID=MMETSP0361-20130328/55373_1 /ASSEMBLY_ACC=CAM_ASM_000343 /TAXON_ID=268821 /ORGANISM="Scrippsiella Hangoei, Strain SHTV-5" /LENGTH=428 /DNA_ID=CAMNT_0051145709 /DNA_START=12 /DNA_END=1298 /DNA_ORIENTATION=+